MLNLWLFKRYLGLLSLSSVQAYYFLLDVELLKGSSYSISCSLRWQKMAKVRFEKHMRNFFRI